MKTAVLTALRAIAVEERPLPEPGPGEVRVQVAAVGVCGSDVHYYAEGRIGNQIARFPTVMGHEPAGVVDALGPGVERLPGHAGRLRVGQRVMIEPAHYCGVCACCRAGRYNQCPDVVFLGTPPVEGIFAEYRNMPADCCIPIPDNVTLTEAALLEPVGVGFHAVKLARMELGETVAIFGCGPIGLSVGAAAHLAGAAELLMVDPIPERRAFAERWLGARTFAVAPDAPDAADATAKTDPVLAWLADRTDGRMADVTVEAAGAQAALTWSCLGARRGGRALLVGIPSVDELAIPMHVCRRAELSLLHVRRANGEAEVALDLVARGRLSVKELATHHFTLDDTASAFELVHAYRDGVIRAVIHPHGDLD